MFNNTKEKVTEKDINDLLCNLILKLDWELVVSNQYGYLYTSLKPNIRLELKIMENHATSYNTSLIIKDNQNKKDPGLNEIETSFPQNISNKIAKHIFACKLKKDQEKDFRNKKEAYNILNKIVNENTK